jgi:hypothetical protein
VFGHCLLNLIGYFESSQGGPAINEWRRIRLHALDEVSQFGGECIGFRDFRFLNRDKPTEDVCSQLSVVGSRLKRHLDR